MIVTEMLKDYRIILGSGSPRRHLLLKELGLTFEVKTFDVSEDFPENLHQENVAMYLADKKSAAFDHLLEERTLVITADTIVCLDDLVLNKPENFQDAKRMLTLLSGRKHEVITGVCLKTRKEKLLFHEKTAVYFKVLTPEEIDFYLNLCQPYDKAGAYGVQEWIGLIGLERIDGSYHNVMGLPVQALYRELARLFST